MGVFHNGEIKMQEMVMGTAIAQQHREAVGSFIRPRMPEQHSEFFSSIPWLFVSSVDTKTGWPRASVIVRAPGTDLFAVNKSQDGFLLSKSGFLKGDKLIENIAHSGSPLGMLGIELHTRRRNRVNGFVSATDSKSITVNVQYSFGNCPKYISGRPVLYDSSRINDAKPIYWEHSTEWRRHLENAFASADTLFIASGNQSNGVDMSHRGGSPGFVKLDSSGNVIRIPDYVGNGFFNTLGNILEEPKVGLLLIDFETSDVTQISGLATIVHGKDPTMHGSERVIRIEVHQVTLIQGALPLSFPGEVALSVFNPPLDGGNQGDKLSLVEMRRETHDTCTLTFEVSRPVRFRAGQYGSFTVSKDGQQWGRAWTISSTPRVGPFGEQRFSITVKHKKGGVVSSLIHDVDVLPDLDFRLLGVEGSFVAPTPDVTKPDDRLVFATAGSGITPIRSILGYLVSLEQSPAVLVFYSVRDVKDIIFGKELIELATKQLIPIKLIINLTQPNVGKNVSNDRLKHEVLSFYGCLGSNSTEIEVHQGRLNETLAQRVLPVSEQQQVSTLYICGPPSFTDFSKHVFKEVPNIVFEEQQ